MSVGTSSLLFGDGAEDSVLDVPVSVLVGIPVSVLLPHATNTPDKIRTKVNSKIAPNPLDFLRVSKMLAKRCNITVLPPLKRVDKAVFLLFCSLLMDSISRTN
ncbi:hypothetical protein D3C81_1876190 [compost metagenome]